MTVIASHKYYTLLYLIDTWRRQSVALLVATLQVEAYCAGGAASTETAEGEANVLSTSSHRAAGKWRHRIGKCLTRMRCREGSACAAVDDSLAHGDYVKRRRTQPEFISLMQS